MPQTPLDAMRLCTPIFTPLPPYSHKTLFPPLSHFLDEGLYSQGFAVKPYLLTYESSTSI